MSASFRPCAVVPTYENPLTVRAVVTEILRHDLPVVLVDDGSGPAGRAACEELRALAQVTVHRHAENRGKGAAVTSGMRIARERGHTHAFQIDADLQHDLARIPDFLAAARAQPEALVLGYPLYDASAPLARRWARRFTHLWVALEVGSRAAIRDAMIGFRVYPLEAALTSGCRGARMDFDVEIAVRMVWAGTPTLNLPVAVRYLAPEEGGISHFRSVRDNLRFSLLHTRLCAQRSMRWVGRAVFRGASGASGASGVP
jgi:glycosyltransferase involved in cell wall biosynthesis